MRRVRQTGHAGYVAVPVLKPTNAKQSNQSRKKKRSKKRTKKKEHISLAYHCHHLQLPHGGARDKVSASAAVAAGAGRKRKHPLVANRHRLPHIYASILPLSLSLSRRGGRCIERRDVCGERVWVRWRAKWRRWLVRSVHRWRRGAHMRRVRVWLMSMRVLLRREPRLCGLEHMHTPQLVAVRWQVRIREARCRWLRGRRQNVRRRLPKRFRVERVYVWRTEAACWWRDGHALRSRLLLRCLWRPAAGAVARARLHRDRAVRVALAFRRHLGRLRERKIADRC